MEEELALVDAVRAEVGEGIEVWRAVSMSSERGPEIAIALADKVDRLVLDAHQGGSGESFDWTTIPEEVRAATLLAGGISPENARAALAVGCGGLDINSGVEYPSGAGEWAGAKDAGAILTIFSTIRTFHY